VERLRAAGTTLGLSIGANNNKLIISPIHPLVPCSLRHSSIRSPLPPARAPYLYRTSTCTSISWHKTTGKRKYVLVLAQTLRTAHTRSRRESCAIQQASSLSISYFLNSLSGKGLLGLVTSTSCSRSHSAKQAWVS